MTSTQPQPETGERHEFQSNTDGSGACAKVLGHEGPLHRCAQPRSSPVHGEPCRNCGGHRVEEGPDGEPIFCPRCGPNAPPASSEEPRIGGRTRQEWCSWHDHRTSGWSDDLDAEFDAWAALMAAAFESKRGQEPEPNLLPESIASALVDEWERIEGESMREGHRATMERLIAAAFESKRGGEGERWIVVELLSILTAIGDGVRWQDAIAGKDRILARALSIKQHWNCALRPVPQSEKENRE